MMRLTTVATALLAAVVFVSACSSRAQEAGEVSAESTTNPRDGSPQDAPAASAMPHGDHNPHHGGVVYMYEELHYEVVLALNGHHRVFFSDASREDLPASVATSVTLTVARGDEAPETLTGVIDEAGESWLLDGMPVVNTNASIRIAFVTKETPYWIDVPFIPATQ